MISKGFSFFILNYSIFFYFIFWIFSDGWYSEIEYDVVSMFRKDSTFREEKFHKIENIDRYNSYLKGITWKEDE